MSLLGSIFGDERDQSRSEMFQKSSELPERPQHKPVPRPKRRDESKAESSVKRRKKKEGPPKANSMVEECKKEDKIEEKSSEPESCENVETDGDGPVVKPDVSNDDGAKAIQDAEERTIFVGNLPLQTTTRKSLAQIFKDCGPIESTRIRSVPVEGVKLPPERAGDQNLVKKVCAITKKFDESLKKTVHGYVVFRNVESVGKALEKNNIKVEGCTIRVDKASPTVEPSRSVFCGNLPYGADEASLQEHFVKGCGLRNEDIEGVRIIRDKDTFKCKGFGYVLFREKSMVSAALKLHNSAYMGKQIRVLVCGKRFKGKKGDSAKSRYESQSEDEKVTVGAFRRILSKQHNEASKLNKRKRGEKKPLARKSTISKRASIDKKVDKRVKKIQKRISKGMGKSRRS